MSAHAPRRASYRIASNDPPEPDGLSQLPIETTCGIYFLWQRSEIVYVGQSKHVTQRIYQHIQDGIKRFDGFSFILTSLPSEHVIWRMRASLPFSMSPDTVAICILKRTVMLFAFSSALDTQVTNSSFCSADPTVAFVVQGALRVGLGRDLDLVLRVHGALEVLDRPSEPVAELG